LKVQNQKWKCFNGYAFHSSIPESQPLPFADSAGESPVQKIFHVLSQSRKAFYGSITFLCIHALQGDTSPLCILIFASGPLPLY
jgi:hypothetical protein